MLKKALQLPMYIMCSIWFYVSNKLDVNKYRHVSTRWLFVGCLQYCGHDVRGERSKYYIAANDILL